MMMRMLVTVMESLKDEYDKDELEKSHTQTTEYMDKHDFFLSWLLYTRP